MKKIFIIYLLIFFSINSLYAQNKIIKGRIVDDQLRTLPYVSILIADTVKVGKTDLNGFFQINIPVSVKKLLFDDVGIDLASIELADICDEVEVVMLLSSSYDFITPKRVERLQLKRFKKLPELHTQAFNKGLFKTATACYKREYIAIYKKKST